jgi:hypothetical protein
MPEIKELDTVVLEKDLPDHGLERGDIGAVVHRYGDGEALEVEFVAGEGTTIALVTLDARAVRPMRRHEILHAREVVA